jgi:iron complex transport system substrate-binding protein
MSKLFSTKNKKLILGITLLVIIVVASYGTYTLLFTSEFQPTSGTITVVDATNAAVTMPKPIDRIVSIIGTEFICALGGTDKIVGRAELTTDEETILPASILDVPLVAETSFDVNLELILEQEPDLVIASEGLDDDIRTQLENAGVFVIEESTTYPRRTTCIQNLGLILNATDKANQFLAYEAQYENLVKDRVKNIAENKKPTVYFEWYQPWYTTCENGSYNEMIATAGGINIAANESGSSTALSPEHVAEQNPDMILRMLTFYDGEDLASYQSLRDDLLTRSALEDTTAVNSEQVYIIKNTALVARRPIGLLYLAKWFHPYRFADIDPGAIHREYVQTFFEKDLSGVFVYPKPTVPQVDSINVVDSIGNHVNLSLPVGGIVSLNPDLTEIICALGGEDKLVGRDENSVFPDSISQITVVAEDSQTPSIELILDLNPALLIADTTLSTKTEELEMLQNASIPVILESTSNFTRIPEIIEYLSLMLNSTIKGYDLIDFITYYDNLVQERIENLTQNEKPKVFIESSEDWNTYTEGSTSHELLVKAGGINVATQTTQSSTTLSAEFVVDQNPDVILKLAPKESDLLSIQALRDDLLTRPGLSSTTAVAEDQVYLYSPTILQGIRYPIGLLYWAKWFNHALFADIDPSSLHDDLLQNFFDIPIDGVYAHPEIATVEDGSGKMLTLHLPVDRIISLNNGLTEIVCALGAEDKLVGRDEGSTIPPSVTDKPIVGPHSYSPNLELILELEPDLIVADSMLPYNEPAYHHLVTAGITIFIADPEDSQPETHADETAVDFACNLVTALSQIVGGKDIAEEFVEYAQYYNALVKERLETVSRDERPKVLLEWYQPYQTFVTPGLDQAGGINIAENQTEYAPTLSTEFVLEQNPDIVIRQISSWQHIEEDFIDMREEILSRPYMSEINAIINEKVYICDFAARGGIRSVIGYLYWAKWCQPELFADIDPEAINDELDQKFFGTTMPSVYAYPLN